MPPAERTYTDLSRPVREVTFEVESPEAGQRLDALLRMRYPWHSRTHFREKLRRGEVSLNGTAAKPSSRVRAGDRVAVALQVDPSVPERETADDLVILYEDEHMLAVDKPSGMAAHPVGRTRHGTLINKLHARYRSDDEQRDTVPRLGHRLDRDTSGVVLIVKNREVDALVTELFTRRHVKKTYLALVEGVPAVGAGTIEAPLGPDDGAETTLHQAVRSDGLPARTVWRQRRVFAHHALLELEPLTGRTHQLRVHLAYTGHPIVADHLYGDPRPLLRSRAASGISVREDGVVLGRLALHSHRLEMRHPVTGRPLRIESPLPADIAGAVRELGALTDRDGAARGTSLAS